MRNHVFQIKHDALLKIIEQTDSSFIAATKQGDICYVNKGAEKLLEIQADQETLPNLEEFIFPDFKREYQKFVQSVFSASQSFHCIITVQSTSGKLSPVIAECMAVDPNLCYIWMTEIKAHSSHTNTRLSQLLFYKSVIENLHEGVAILDATGSFTYTNEACQDIFEATADQMMAMKILDFVDPGNWKRMNQLNTHLSVGEKSSHEVVVKTFSGLRKFLNITLSPLLNEKKELTDSLAIIRDISDSRNQEAKMVARLEIEEIIAQIATSFLNVTSYTLNKAIDMALAKMGKYYKVDRTNLFLFSDENRYFSNTNEWCAVGIASQKENLQLLPVQIFPWMMEKLNAFEIFLVPAVKDMPPAAKAEKEILEYQEIKTAFVLPVHLNNTLLGYIGIDSVTHYHIWEDSDIQALSTLAVIFGNAIARVNYETRLNQINKKLNKIVVKRTREIEKITEINQ
ncbi:MAG: PAS domain-containing protein, partial [Marinilabiliales bacterium]|nr:PAS domain-containing protein [Marinilabiliales bacterium]